MSAAVDNVRYECGFGGARWGTNEGAHFGWCMGLASTSMMTLGPVSVPMPDAWQKAHEQATAEAGARAQAIAQCKATHVPRDCKSCHGGSSQVSTAPARVVPSALRTTPGRGTSSGGSDQVKRGGPNPCGSELKPCKPQQRVLGPGLLEGGGALGTQGPAATGSPIQTGAPPQLQRGGGGGVPGLR